MDFVIKTSQDFNSNEAKITDSESFRKEFKDYVEKIFKKSADVIEQFEIGDFEPTILTDICQLDINDEAAWSDYGITGRLQKKLI